MEDSKRYLGLATLVVTAMLVVLVACGTQAPTPTPVDHTLSVVILGTGSGTVTSDPPGIDCGDGGGDCQAIFADDRLVTLIASPAAGDVVASWSGCDSEDGERCDLRMTSDRTVSVRFVAEAAGAGAISGTLIFPGDFDVRGATTGADVADVADVAVAQELRGTGAAAVVPGEVVVRFGARSEQRLGTMQVAGVAVARERAVAGGTLELYRAEGLTEHETLALVEAMRARPDVEEAFPNWVMRPFKRPNDEFYALQWHYRAIDLPRAWDIEDGTSRPVVVAVVDTGITEHPDLRANVLPGYDFVAGDADARDEGGLTDYHGTHVAGTIAAVTDNALGVAGVSWGAQVVPVRVIGSTGEGTTVDVVDGIIWGAGNPADEPLLPPNAHPARVVNISVGGNIGEPCPAALDFTFGQLVDSGIILIAAAGNDNVDARHTFPANCSNVIAVGATGPDNERAPYSNYGSVIDVVAPGGDISQRLDIAGESILAGVLSTVATGTAPSFTYGFYQGTSMAAPHVAGVAALMLAADPSLTFSEVATKLQESARPLTATACRRPSGSDCGAGLIDAAGALAIDVEPPPPPPPPPPEEPTTDVPTYVVAFYCLASGTDPCHALDLDRSGELVVPTTSNRVPYTVTGLEPGTYLVAAWQDLNRNVVVDPGEPFGQHPELITVGPGELRTGVQIHLDPLTVSAPLDTSLRDALQRHLGSRER